MFIDFAANLLNCFSVKKVGRKMFYQSIDKVKVFVRDFFKTFFKILAWAHALTIDAPRLER